MFDFDKVYDRRPTSTFKWDALPDLFQTPTDANVIPMWVADMDFAVAPVIEEAWQARMQHPIYGYTKAPDSLYTAITHWQARYGWTIHKEDILFYSGVVPALAAIIRECTPADATIVISTPAYYPFKDVPERLGRTVVECPLTIGNERFEYDFAALEDMLKTSDAYILCNPHNPGGTVWSQETLARIVTLCRQYDVLLISDEIHADLVFAPHTHVPAMPLTTKEDRFISLIAPTKTFNLAGIQFAVAVTANKDIYIALQTAATNAAQSGPHIFAIAATEAAYTQGQPWLDALMDYLAETIHYVKAELEQIDGIRVWAPEASYLMWMDVRGVDITEKELMQRFKEQGVIIYPGSKFGVTGEGFFRINIASPRSVIKEAVVRMKRALQHA